MSRNLMPIMYGALAVLAVALGLFVANLFGNPAITPTGPTNSVASVAVATAAPTAPTNAPAAPTAEATAAPVPPTLVVGAEPTAEATAAPVPPTLVVGAEPTATPAPTAEPAEAAFLEYTVQRNDSLKSIAQRYNTTVTALLEANELRNPDSLTVGTVIKVPRT